MTGFKSALFGAMLAVGVTGASAALAANPEFCRDYARSAVQQFHESQEHERCRDRAQGSRWSDDWRNHFNWCLGVSREQARGEREAREDTLRECREHHHHDHWDH